MTPSITMGVASWPRYRIAEVVLPGEAELLDVLGVDARQG